jgi:Glycosyl hydrolase family 20, catalytic domain
MELVISERVVTVPKPLNLIKSTTMRVPMHDSAKTLKNVHSQAADAEATKPSAEKWATKHMAEDHEVVAKVVQSRVKIGEDGRAHPPSRRNEQNKQRPDALTLASEMMQKQNIDVKQTLTKMPPTRSTTRERPRNHGVGLHANIWHDNEKEMFDNVTMPNDFVLEYPMVDPLSKHFNTSSLHRINYQPEVPHLGVLLDAGRHYFNVHWIHRLIDVLAALNYNLLHFRLTDDQSFNVLLNAQPLLAYPSALHNNTRVYSPQELRDIVRYARSKGIQVIPEVNVPGHAGSWGGIPDLIVQCPKFICEKGYGIPLNVSNPKLYPILKDVLSEIVDIFDHPPYIHLGGDEVDMAETCFEEVGEEIFNYENFESILTDIIKGIGYNDSQIIRWETTGRIDNGVSRRAGKITHFWFEHPGTSPVWRNKYGSDFHDPVFLSSGLYFDTNADDSAWEVYVKTKQLKHMMHKESPILGIIAGAFELDSKFWLDRNVVGRLLAVSMGVSGLNTTVPDELYTLYRDACTSVGFHDELCVLYGRPPMQYAHFRNELKDGKKSNVVWRHWIDDICKRFTFQVPTRGYRSRPSDQNNYSKRLVDAAKEKFWMSLYKDTAGLAQETH